MYSKLPELTYNVLFYFYIKLQYTVYYSVLISIGNSEYFNTVKINTFTMRRKGLLTITLMFILIFYFNRITQSQIFKRKIEWTDNLIAKDINNGEKKPDNDRTIYYLHFHGATYHQKTLLPEYNELITLPQNTSEVIAAFVDVQYENLPDEQIKNIQYIENIQAEIYLESKLVHSGKKAFMEYAFLPVRKNKATGKYEKVVEFSIQYSTKHNRNNSFKSKKYASQSVLRSGNWVKIKIERDGIYQLTFDELRELGFADPEKVRVFGSGGEMLSKVNSDPQPDDLKENRIYRATNYILFYGKGTTKWNYDSENDIFTHTLHSFSDYAYYFLTDKNTGYNNLISEETPVNGSATHTTSTYHYRQFYEKDSVNLLRSGEEWYWRQFNTVVTEHGFRFHVPGMIDTSPKVTLSLVSHSKMDNYFNVKTDGLNENIYMTPITSSQLSEYADKKIVTLPFSTSSDDVRFTLNYNFTDIDSKAWLDFILLNTKRELQVLSNQMHFRNTTTYGTDNITKFNLTGVNSGSRIWDITDPTNISELKLHISGSTAHFTTATDTIKEFIAFNNSAYLKPITKSEDTGPVANQNLHALPQTKFIIVSDTLFMEYAEELAQLHRDFDGMHVTVVTPEQIYNEFSSGTPDVTAIRNFVKMFYDRADSVQALIPKYLLLFGDGSFDNKTQSQGNTNFIPTYQSQQSLLSTASFVTDDFFGMLDDDEYDHIGLVDIGIGRLPVKNKTEAQQQIDKIKRYISTESKGDWQNMLCFIGDDADDKQLIHMTHADSLARMTARRYPYYNIDKILLDAYPQISSSSAERYPEAAAAINRRIQKGALIINYTGHGNEERLTEEDVITMNSILNWDNYYLPIFMTATCEFSRFDDYDAENDATTTTAGEMVLLNPDGGGIALFTTTRLVFSGDNMELNYNFYQYVFERDENNERYRLGDIVRLTKRATGKTNSVNKRNFTLLGDPAIQLAYPKYKVMTSTINHQNIEDATDTIKALSEVTITGYIADTNGEKLNDFNGRVYPTIYDKERHRKTLNNDNAGVINFTVQNNILYKGKSTVNNGEFSFTFIVPKDIGYDFGKGKISYYAKGFIDQDSTKFADATGYYNNIIIGGSNTSAETDNQGPDIDLYLNDENFVFGGITNETPVLLAFVKDKNGINTVGNGIGHDITAVLDNNTNNILVLNDYYEADNDSYKSGTIQYPFTKLSEGHHSIRLKVWDIYNNSSEAYLEFIVAKSSELILERLFNYPNPFQYTTNFCFQHNQSSTSLDVEIKIYNLSGGLVKTIKNSQHTEGYLSEPVSWDGTTDNGQKLESGIYIYQTIVQSTVTGQTVKKSGKLLLMK